MILYFMREARAPASYPRQIMDLNLCTDYGRLRRLLIDSDGTPRVRPIEHVRLVLSEGHIDAVIHDSFPLDRAYEDAFFVSYLYYMGMLTIASRVRERFRLVVPNQLVLQLYWENFRALLDDVLQSKVNSIDLTTNVEAMAFQGDLEPFLSEIFARVLNRLSNRDFIKMDEKPIKLILFTYLNLSGVYRAVSVPELNRGYVDLLLQLSKDYDDAPFNFLIEVKYLKRGDGTQARIDLKFEEAETQLLRYLG